MKHKHYVDIVDRYTTGFNIREDEMEAWCKENVEPYDIIYQTYPYTRWYFMSEEDAMAFKLRWL